MPLAYSKGQRKGISDSLVTRKETLGPSPRQTARYQAVDAMIRADIPTTRHTRSAMQVNGSVRENRREILKVRSSAVQLG